MAGDGMDPDVMESAARDMAAADGIGIPTITPWNKEFVFEKLDYLRQHEPFAVAMDVDGAGLPFLKKYNPNAGSKSVAELKEIIEYANKPFTFEITFTAATTTNGKKVKTDLNDDKTIAIEGESILPQSFQRNVSYNESNIAIL